MPNKSTKYKPAKISDEAYKCLRIASALLDRDMRDLASEAILAYCHPIIEKEMGGVHQLTKKKKKL